MSVFKPTSHSYAYKIYLYFMESVVRRPSQKMLRSPDFNNGQLTTDDHTTLKCCST